MSQCHDPYDAIDAPTVIAIAESRAPNGGQCHDSYESVGLTTADPLAVAAKTVTTTKAVAATKNRPRPRGRIVVGVDGSGASRDALRWAARQAQLTGASLEAVISWEIAATSYYPARPYRAATTPRPTPRLLLARPSIASSASLTVWR
jgi:hypothetical protein